MNDEVRSKVIIAIGTNYNREANIKRAKERLTELFEGRVAFSEALETDPIGMGGEKFINLLSTIYTSLSLCELELLLKETERYCGDTETKRRQNIVEMDIDILEYNGMKRHEQDHERPYIKRLLSEEQRKMDGGGLSLAGAIILAILSLCSPRIVTVSHAQDFDKHFTEQTLRIDYIFAGDARQQSIFVDRLSVIPGWYGKHRRLAELPVEGNGQITVRSHKTGETLYRNSFSTLFQEWLTYEEAASVSRSFENVFLVPMPKDTVDITVDLRNNRREITASLTHTVIPTDILIRHISENGVTPYVTLQAATDSDRCIHIAYIAEGYTADEMPLFIADAEAATEALFSHEPFKSKRDRFNITAVKAVSAESGTSEPGNGLWRNTALGSHFDTFYSERYLTTLNLKTLHDLLAGTPYEHIIVLVNTEKYGGGGILNSYNLAMTHHEKFRPVVVHEFGHSFAGLADEYAYENEPIPMYPPDVEPWEANITTLVDFGGKWGDLTDELHEGAGYSLKGVYRAAEDCRMRTNECPEFCIVCRRAIERLIDFYTE